MRTSRLPLALLSTALLGLLAACAPQPDANAPADPAAPAAEPVAEAPAPVADDDALRTCNAEAVQSLIGQEATEAVVAQATADSGSASVRVLKPGQPATMDFRQDRLNILTDDSGRIEQLSCG